MKIADGYNDKETEIRIYAREDNVIELWINQTGIEDGKAETLAYMTPNELLQLFKEVQEAGTKLFGASR